MDHHQLATSLLSRPTFDVVAWIDPVCANGVPSDSDEALVILCPVLGPSATLVLHRLSRYATAGPTVVGTGSLRSDIRHVEELSDRTGNEGDHPSRPLRVRHDRAVSTRGTDARSSPSAAMDLGVARVSARRPIANAA